VEGLLFSPTTPPEDDSHEATSVDVTWVCWTWARYPLKEYIMVDADLLF